MTLQPHLDSWSPPPKKKKLRKKEKAQKNMLGTAIVSLTQKACLELV